MSEGMRQGQKEHLGPRGSLWTALGSHGKLRFVCISSELGHHPPPTPQSQPSLFLCPKHLQRPKRPRPTAVGALIPQASHQACVIAVHTFRLLHHAGEAAGTG